jgi:hypothetical protein
MRRDIALPAPFDGPLDQLTAELDWLDRRLAAHVAALRRAGRFNDDPLHGLYIGDAEAAALLEPTDAADPAAEILALHRAALDTRAAHGPHLPLAAIARGFGLDAIDRAALVIAAAPALDRRYASLFAYAQNDIGRRLPTPDLILALVTDSRETRLAGLARFAAGAPLIRHGLVTIAEAEQARPLADRGLGVDDRIVTALLGETAPDPRIADHIARPPADLPAEPHLTAQVAAALAAGNICILFEGPVDAGQHAAVRAALAERGQRLLVVDADAVGGLALPLGREARLQSAALLLTTRDGGIERLATALAAPDLPVFIAARPGAFDAATIAARRAVAVIAVAPPPVQRRADWWRTALPAPQAASASHLARQCRLGPFAITEMLACIPNDADIVATASAAAAARAGGRLPAIARRVDAAWRWDDLLLPERQQRQLVELADTLAHWPRVIADWGFAARTPRPQNCVAMFTGPSGTGKTMAASLVAAVGGVPLYRVDLAAVFDKYIGETEKQLDRLFDAADEAGAALLFDEADALFGKRTETQSSHDRYANLSTAYLLQRIEAHDGLVILTSNLPGNVDDAFARRLAALIAFPLPGIPERRRLWANAFPGAAPLAADLDLDAIADTFDLSGGNIRNAAIAAAYRAAADDSAISRRHVLGAVARELEKLGRAPIAADFGDLAGHR